jgi:hypothetical protein
MITTVTVNIANRPADPPINWIRLRACQQRKSEMRDSQPCPTEIQSFSLNPCLSDRLGVIEEDSALGARLVAKRPFRCGDLILPLTGRLSEATYRTIQVGERAHLEGSLLAFMNHSCRPSAVVVTQELAIRAWTDLEIGEEVTFFYPSTEWDMVRPFECLCKAPNCMGHVSGAKHVSLGLLSCYFINPHIRKLATYALALVMAPSHTYSASRNAAAPGAPAP